MNHFQKKCQLRNQHVMRFSKRFINVYHNQIVIANKVIAFKLLFYLNDYVFILYGTDEGAHWTRVERNKRQRRSTGGTFNQKNTYESQFSLSTEDFKALPTDDKLVTLFELMTNVGSVHGRIGQVENKVNDIHNQVSQNVCRIKLLESIKASTPKRGVEDITCYFEGSMK